MNFSKCLPLSDHSGVRLPFFFSRLAYEAEINLLSAEVWFEEDNTLSLSPSIGQGGLACCNSWGHKESDTTERLN